MSGLGGHRQEYQSLFASIFHLEPSIGKVGRHNISRLVWAEAIFFGTIDDDYIGFIVVALLRAVLGRRTVGLFLRPQTCFLTTALRYKAKKTAFSFLKSIQRISVFTIIPFSISSDYALVADDGLVDPQMWDKVGQGYRQADERLMTQIRTAAQGRCVLAFLGTANQIKGIEFLHELMKLANWPKDRISVVVAGRFPDELQQVEQGLVNQGAIVYSRFISNAELLAVYSEADLVWACYHPDYDQASGIFGRAVQFNKTAVVRSSSQIARFARENSLRALELDCATPNSAANLLANYNLNSSYDATTKIANWKREFIKKIGEAL